MNYANGRGLALARAAEAMLRALGGGEVTLRCPAGAAQDADASQLGREAPVSTEVAIAPAVVRASGNGLEVLLAPASVAQYARERGQSAQEFFAAVMAVRHGGREFRVRSFAAAQFAGTEYLYRISLE